jgi:hypothetical protein
MDGGKNLAFLRNMGKLHSNLVRDSIKYLNSLPESHFVPYTPSPYGKRSVSDIIGCYEGRYVAIEIKIGKDIPTPLQKRFLRKVQEARGFARACWSIEEVKQFMFDVDKKL